MDLRQLQALTAIADTGSFSGAASALHTVQSNVSSHIAHLERELGAQLVDRHGGTLTEEGVAVVERARRISAELEALVADVAALRDEIVGTVRIGMIGTTARWLAPLLLDRLSVSHPKVRMVIGDGTSTTLELQLVGGTLDLGIVNLPHTTPELSARALFDEDLILVVPIDHPLASRDRVEMADLDGFELLLPAPGTTFRREIDDASRAAGISLVPLAELDGLRLMAALTYRGYGPAILPATGAADIGPRFARVTVEGLPPRQVGVVTRRRGRPSAPARALLEVLDAVIADDLERSPGLHRPEGDRPATDG